jgi:hypothetical protein
MGQYYTMQNTVAKLCDALASRDTMQSSFLSGTPILEALKVLKMPLNSAQMAKITAPLPVDPLDSSYNYAIRSSFFLERTKPLVLSKNTNWPELGLQSRQPNCWSQIPESKGGLNVSEVQRPGGSQVRPSSKRRSPSLQRELPSKRTRVW